MNGLLLHHVLTVLVHAVIKDAVELTTDIQVHRAVNALLFVRHVLRLLLVHVPTTMAAVVPAYLLGW